MLSMYLGKQCVFLSSNSSERNVISNINAWVNYSKKEDTVLEIGFPIGFHVVWIKERHLNMFIGFCICSCFRDWVLKGFFIKLLKKPCKKTKNR